LSATEAGPRSSPSLAVSITLGPACAQFERTESTKKGRTKIFSIPYSEHSSFSELRELVNTLRPRKIVPTVNIERTQARIGYFAR